MKKHFRHGRQRLVSCVHKSCQSGRRLVRAAIWTGLELMLLALAAAGSTLMTAKADMAAGADATADTESSEESQAVTEETSSSSGEVINTLENQTVLSGTAKEGTVIGITVYNFRYGANPSVLYTAQETVGASGLYQITVPLPVEGRQYVEIEMDGKTSLYTYNRFSKSIVDQLNNYYLNVYDYLKDETP